MLTLEYSKSFIDACKESLPSGLWSEFIDHPFVRGIANGTLPLESFIFYLKQDYLYLQHYARAAALAAYKGTKHNKQLSPIVYLNFTTQ